MKNDLHERIRQRLNDLNMSEEAASKAMGGERSYLRKLLERPASSPRGATLRKLASALQCSEAWLLTGADEPSIVTASTPLTSMPKVFANTNTPPEAPAPETSMDIPVMGTAAGSHVRGAFQLEGGIVDYVRRPHALAGARDIYALYVEGSSMEPQYFAGDLIYVNPHRPARPGDIVVVQSRMAKHSDNEASLGIYVRQTEKILVLGKRNPVGSEVELNRDYVTAIHKVLTINELFGV
ncbi:S24 family peptidase [Agrobacterium vitis]|uniref:S24 family peptidase n=1 Tax=Agrobacterium vitis TaxID=373 RepID=UPI001574267A|nr:S24 family peptidase [Agrobacterium vitis]NSY21919.1 helix-turn-helix transcriptional regulator [Agrobacterium vitis]WEO73209.1 S24 family peptidase [Agrobacterium vitis]